MSPLLFITSIATTIKLLLTPAYESTDFSVHLNWLNLTSTVPLSQWYISDDNVWTLDYPPFFAYFEFLLSFFFTRSGPTLLTHRLTVILSDLALILSAHLLTRRLVEPTRNLILICVIWSPALLIVDHVHFQYNGYLLGILLMSLWLLREGRDWFAGVVFAALICSKHLFMVAGPVYFVYLLRHFCRGGIWKGCYRFLGMGMGVGVVFAAAFGPWVYYGQIPQLLRRLFPFGRGLCHAYWAPNFWVFYIILDKALAFMLMKLGFNIQMPKASFTGGLVGDSSPFAVLPQVTPLVTFLLVLLAISPCIVKAFLNPKPKSVIRWVSYAYTCGYMFGWHVHEKASLHFTIPLGIIALESLEDAKHYFLLSIVSCYSLFPLLFEPQEYPIKVLLLLLHSTLLYMGFSNHFSRRESSAATRARNKGKGKSKRPEATSEKKCLIGWIGICYLLGSVFIEIWGQILHPFIFGKRFPFLPLILVSTYCAIGMMYSWLWQLRQIILHT